MDRISAAFSFRSGAGFGGAHLLRRFEALDNPILDRNLSLKRHVVNNAGALQIATRGHEAEFTQIQNSTLGPQSTRRGLLNSDFKATRVDRLPLKTKFFIHVCLIRRQSSSLSIDSVVPSA